MDNEVRQVEQKAPENSPAPQPTPAAKTASMREIQKATAWVMIVGAVLFAIIAVLAIWGAFESGDIIWKSLTTIAVIVFASLVINVGSRIYDNVKK